MRTRRPTQCVDFVLDLLYTDEELAVRIISELKADQITDDFPERVALIQG
jgi:hypothetical protein